MLPRREKSVRMEGFQLHWLGFILGLLFVFLSAGNAKTTLPQGELKIEGEDILRLVLNGDHQVILEKPGSTIQLPAGKYQMVNVTVGKNNSDARFVLTIGHSLEVSTNKTAVLRAGGPLTNRIAVVQQGRTLHLDYQLLGALGQSYAPEDTRRVPRFKVSRNGKTVGSGTFEFG